MHSLSKELGIITAYMKNLETQIIPRALAVKKRVFAGESLTQADIRFFEQHLSEAGSIMHLLEHHPEYQKLAVEMANMYLEIKAQAMKNNIKNSKTQQAI